MPQEQGNGARLSHQIGNRNSVFSTGKKTLHLTQAHGFQAGFSDAQSWWEGQKRPDRYSLILQPLSHFAY